MNKKEFKEWIAVFYVNSIFGKHLESLESKRLDVNNV
jgi:hypothetical protein